MQLFAEQLPLEPETRPTMVKSNFQLANLCGTVYRQGNVLFTRDGNSVVSPLGNRVGVFDLVK